MNTIAPRQVLITGADKGLGLALVSCFLRGDFQVYAGSYFSSRNLEAHLQEYGQRLVVFPLDVTDMASIREAVIQVVRLTPALDILINNAGVHLHKKPSQLLRDLDLTDGHLERTLDVNAFGPLRITQQFLPLLDQGAMKLIVNISSEAGSIGDCQRKGEFAYCMSKAALNMQSRILQNNLGDKGFRVLAVHPGWMRTDMGGPEADIHPDEAAEGIFKLAMMPREAQEPIYLDYRGEALQW